jgi:rSAM/selenodomain-associated transferase 1
MTTLLVIAKAPVPGEAKTRLAPEFGSVQAARLAAASLLDTLTTVLRTPADHRVVAFTGDLAGAECADDVRRLLTRFTVIPQRGDGFGARLANAHADSARLGGGPVVQIGMDTPQVTTECLLAAATATRPGTAALGPADDGGWWVLGLSNPEAATVLAEVPMSTSQTGALTAAALRGAGLTVQSVAQLRDVDNPADAAAVAALCHPESRFRAELFAARLAQGA